MNIWVAGARPRTLPAAVVPVTWSQPSVAVATLFRQKARTQMLIVPACCFVPEPNEILARGPFW